MAPQRLKGMVELREAATGALTRRVGGSKAVILVLAFSPDGRRLLAYDARQRLWRYAVGR